MKVELTKEGYIQVTAETIVEAWALNGVWPLDDKVRDKNQDRVMVDCSILSNTNTEGLKDEAN